MSSPHFRLRIVLQANSLNLSGGSGDTLTRIGDSPNFAVTTIMIGFDGLWCLVA